MSRSRSPAVSGGREVLQAFEEALAKTDNPIAAARALRRVAARHPLAYDGQRRAFRWEAEKLLRPFFEPDIKPFEGEEGAALKAAKAVTWLALDAAWAAVDRRG